MRWKIGFAINEVSGIGLTSKANPPPDTRNFNMEALYFAFANQRDRPLHDLDYEDAETNRALEPLAAQGHFGIVRDSFATLESMSDKLRAHRQRLVLFHYGGHAGNDRIDLEGQSARIRGIAELLGQCPNLKLVVLNGCATIGQVQALHDRGIPAVLATYRAVEDDKAAKFAVQFYRTLANFDPLTVAFSAARGYAAALDDSLEISLTRGLAPRGRPANTPCWTLSVAPGQDDLLRWSLPQRTAAAPGAARTSHHPPSEDMETNVFVRRMREALAGGKIGEVIRQLQEYMQHDRGELYDELINHSDRWENLSRKIRIGIIRHDDANMERSLIVISVLELLTKLEKRPV